MPANILNPRRFTSEIAKHTDYLENLPHQDITHIPRHEFKKQRGRAIKLGSLALANERIETHGEYDLDANLFTLVANTASLLESYTSMTEFKKDYMTPNSPKAPAVSLDKYYENKDRVIAFNHSLKEVINAGASKMNFNDLLEFMTNIHMAINGSSQQQQFHHIARENLIGMRNEVAFEQILIAAGIEYTSGTVEQDAKGGDFIINGKPIDVKSSETSARNAQERAYRNGYNATHIMWSQVNFEDFGGALALPQAMIAKKIPAVSTLVDIATRSQTAQQQVS